MKELDNGWKVWNVSDRTETTATAMAAEVPNDLTSEASAVKCFLLWAINAWELKDADWAIYYLGEALSRDPRNVEALVMLGIVHGEIGNIDEAQWFFDEAVRTDPSHERALFQRRVFEGHREYLAEEAKKLQAAKHHALHRVK